MAISAVVGAVTAVSSVKAAREQKKARKSAEEANRVAMRQESLRAQRERVQALRQSRVRQAAATAFSINSNTSSASTTQGAMGSFQTQFAANSAFTGQMNQLTSQRMELGAQAEAFSQSAEFYGSTIPQAASKIGGFIGEFNK